VILGFDKTLTYDKLRTACDLIRRGVLFIATHPDFNCPTPEEPIPDCGAMIALITAVTGVKPKIIGKPNTEMVEALCAKFGINRSKVAMIGDRPELLSSWCSAARRNLRIWTGRRLSPTLSPSISVSWAVG
jgi:4-nitrophenyl phosphatase